MNNFFRQFLLLLVAIAAYYVYFRNSPSSNDLRSPLSSKLKRCDTKEVSEDQRKKRLKRIRKAHRKQRIKFEKEFNFDVYWNVIHDGPDGKVSEKVIKQNHQLLNKYFKKKGLFDFQKEPKKINYINNATLFRNMFDIVGPGFDNYTFPNLD